MKTVLILSGGMDSTTLAYQLREDELSLISFDYGQKHLKELDYATKTAKQLEARHDVVDLSGLGKLLVSSLTDIGVPVPEGHYEAENMAATVVPNRNSIMLSIAFGVAVSREADRVAFAAHAGDHYIYPDCRPAFVRAFSEAETIANLGFGKAGLYIFAPYLDLTKADIASIGGLIGVPYGDTWSCYKGGSEHCGRCGTCVERKEAFRLSKVIDPTPYKDEIYEVLAYRG